MGNLAAQEKPAQFAHEVEHDEIGFTMERRPVRTFHKVHQHSEVEVGILDGGGMNLLFGEERRAREPNRLSICWAAVPHGAITVASGNPIGYSLTIPLALFISWRLPSELTSAVLHGRLLEAKPQSEPCSDLALMKHWHKLMEENDPVANEIILHEVQGRLRRFARELPSARAKGHPSKQPSSDRATELFERMLSEIQGRHREPLTVRQIAQSVGIGPDHARHVFATVCGISIYEYVTRCRIFTAQRLLAITNEKITAIGQASGFRSSDCFHDAFKNICGVTPRQYRNQIRGKS